MALLWIEGFEGFGRTHNTVPAPTNIVGTKYTCGGENNMCVFDGQLGGYAMRFQHYSCYINSPIFSTTDDTVVLGFRYMFESNYQSQIVNFYGDGTSGVNIRLLSGANLGKIQIRKGSSTLLIESPGVLLLEDTWHYIEIKIVTGATGSVSMYLAGNPTPVLEVTGVDTRPNGTVDHHDQFILPSMPSGQLMRFDDLYFLDGSGAFNNDILGEMRVVAISPDADETQGWTRAAGSDNYALVDDAVRDVDDTGLDYVATDTDTVTDLYSYETMVGKGIVSDVRGIQINTDCRKSGTDPFSLITPVKVGSTEYDDSAQIIPTAEYVIRTRVVELNPDDGEAWEIGDIDSAYFGIKCDVP